MRSFIRDRLSQVVTGALTATTVYAVLTLRGVDADVTGPAPRLSVTLAVLLTVLTVLLIMAHLDHLAHGLQVGEVARRISQEGEEVLAATVRSTGAERPAAARTPPAGAAVLSVPAPRDGWATQAPADRILAVLPPGTTVRLETRAGAYIHAGEPLITVWPVPGDRKSMLRRLSGTVVIADTPRGAGCRRCAVAPTRPTGTCSGRLQGDAGSSPAPLLSADQTTAFEPRRPTGRCAAPAFGVLPGRRRAVRSSSRGCWSSLPLL